MNGSGVSPNTPNRESQLLSEIGMADISTEELLKVTDALADRLHSVTRDEPDTPASTSEEPVLVDRASRVRAIRISIEDSTCKLRKIVETLEV